MTQTLSTPNSISSEDPWKKALLLPRFYERSALSASGIQPVLKFAKFGLGYGYINESTSPPTPEEIPDNLSKIPNEFYTGTFTSDDFVYNNGLLMMRCQMPRGSISEPKQYSMVGIYDEQDNLLAVSVTVSSWVSPDEAVGVNAYINYLVEAE